MEGVPYDDPERPGLYGNASKKAKTEGDVDSPPNTPPSMPTPPPPTLQPPMGDFPLLNQPPQMGGPAPPQ